jgi:hypothetical protein
MIFTMNDALLKLLPNVEWKITDNDLAQLEILSDFDGSIPTKKQIDDAIKALENEYNLSQQQKATEKAALLAKLGITADEARLLLS